MTADLSTPLPPDRSPDSWSRCLGRIGAALALFVLANFILGAVLDRSLIRGGKGENGVINDGRRVRPEVLILGSSRAKHHYDDRLLTELLKVRCFNAGFGGQGLPFSRVVFEQITAVNKPRLVVIDVMVFDEDMKRVHALDPWYPRSPVLRALAAGDEARNGSAALAGIEKSEGDWRNRILMAIPAYRYAGRSWTTLKDRYRKGTDYGFEPLKTKPSTPENPSSPPPKQNKWLIPQLDALVSQAQAVGAQVVLIFSPILNDDYEDAVVRPTRAYARDKKVPFLVYDRETYPVFKDLKLFSDRGHLNAAGAEVFSRLIAGQLQAGLGDPTLPPATR